MQESHQRRIAQILFGNSKKQTAPRVLVVNKPRQEIIVLQFQNTIRNR